MKRNIYNIIFFLVLLLTNGCYSYKYHSSSTTITCSGNNITDIYIESEDGMALAHFERITDTIPSSVFSLKDFSPKTFKLVDEKSFSFERGKIYYVHILPTGDMTRLPIKIKVNQDESIVKVAIKPNEHDFW